MQYLSWDPLDLAALLGEVTAPGRGGVASFLGLVRNHHEGRAVQAIEYHGYEEMAESVSRQVIEETEGRWPVRVALRHRLGMLAVGDVAVAVVAAGAHRDEAFAACRFVIDEIKRRVPIWKRERFEDGSEEWVDPTGEQVASTP